MKSNYFIEYQGKKTDIKQIEDSFKELWKEKGGKIKDLKEVNFYFKPEEEACYYVVDETVETGKIIF